MQANKAQTIESLQKFGLGGSNAVKVNELLETQRILFLSHAAALDQIDAILTFDMSNEQMKAEISSVIEACRGINQIELNLAAKKIANAQSPSTVVPHQPSFPPLRQVVDTNLGPAGYLGGAWFKWWAPQGQFALVATKGNVLWWIGEDGQMNHMTDPATSTIKTDLIWDA